MRKWFVVIALIGPIAVTGGADDPKPGRDKVAPAKIETPTITLKPGDPAPALKVSKWLQGEEIRKFEPGKVYVVEFWATWCGPCLGVMPQLTALQAEYKDKGLTVVGVTVKDDKNSAAAVGVRVVMP